MAYRTQRRRSRYSARPSGRYQRAGRSYGRRRTSRVGTRRGRRASAGRTVRIVIEQPAANPVARPPLGLTEASPPQRSMF